MKKKTVQLFIMYIRLYKFFNEKIVKKKKKKEQSKVYLLVIFIAFILYTCTRKEDYLT